MIRFDINYKPFVKKVNDYFKKCGIEKNSSSGADKIAKKKCALQLLDWIVNGSPNESTQPPIYQGILRGSGSVFVDSEKVGDSSNGYPNGKPNESFQCKANEIVVGFDTAYAARMHEETWTHGPKSSGKVGNKYVEKHLIADKDNIMKTYALIFKKESGG